MEKVVFITGGLGLLGKTFIENTKLKNIKLVSADINHLKSDIISENLIHVKVDITNEDSLREAIDFVVKNFGKIDCLINSAYPRNSHYGKKLMDVSYESFCENINLNLGGYFLTSKLFASYFLKQGEGNIINVSSIYGVMAPRFEVYENTSMTMPVEYSVIKSGLIHLTKYFSKFFKGQNIRVNSISPGGLENGQPKEFLNKYKEHCLNKGMLEAKDIVGTLDFLISNESQYINGQNIIIDDGFTL